MSTDLALPPQESSMIPAALRSSTTHCAVMEKWVGRSVFFIAVAGAILRVALAFRFYPWIGDPTWDYSYRGLLFADGQWRAAFLTWHLPGYPLLLGLLTKLSGGLISPYVWGTIVSIMSYLGLVFLIDRLITPRTRWPSSRIAVASFLALYETLFIYTTGPLTEPLYLFILFTAVWIVDCERISLARSALMGGLLGLACMMRMEGLVPFLGLLLFVTMRAAVGPGRLYEAACIAASAILGCLVTFGWLLFFPDYLGACRKAYYSSFTIPPVQGVAGNLVRLAECTYYACTVWLPFALLLPYWILLAIGLTHPARAPGKAPLHGLLLAVTVPSLFAVASTVMVKRTASFLFPAAGVWFGLGLEVIAVRLALDRTRRGWAILLCIAVAFNLLQASRILYNLRKSPPMSDPASYIAAQLLSEHSAESGSVWGFGSEPEIYAFWNQPLYAAVWSKKEYYPCYTENLRNPKGFVDELRRRSFKYLMFTLTGEKPNADSPDIEHQQFTLDSGPFRAPLRSDLCALIKNCEENGLQFLGERAGKIAVDGKPLTCQVYVYRILH